MYKNQTADLYKPKQPYSQHDEVFLTRIDEEEAKYFKEAVLRHIIERSGLVAPEVLENMTEKEVRIAIQKITQERNRSFKTLLNRMAGAPSRVDSFLAMIKPEYIETCAKAILKVAPSNAINNAHLKLRESPDPTAVAPSSSTTQTLKSKAEKKKPRAIQGTFTFADNTNTEANVMKDVIEEKDGDKKTEKEYKKLDDQETAENGDFKRNKKPRPQVSANKDRTPTQATSVAPSGAKKRPLGTTVDEIVPDVDEDKDGSIRKNKRTKMNTRQKEVDTNGDEGIAKTPVQQDKKAKKAASVAKAEEINAAVSKWWRPNAAAVDSENERQERLFDTDTDANIDEIVSDNEVQEEGSDNKDEVNPLFDSEPIDNIQHPQHQSFTNLVNRVEVLEGVVKTLQQYEKLRRKRTVARRH